MITNKLNMAKNLITDAIGQIESAPKIEAIIELIIEIIFGNEEKHEN